MRFKLILLIKPDSFGNILPVSYQYELSSCIFKKMTEDRLLYDNWMRMNGFIENANHQNRLFSISNFYIPHIKVEQDRLYLLTKRIQVWLSFLPERGTVEFVESVFANTSLLIGDKKSRVNFLVEQITVHSEEPTKHKMQYLSLSPIVFSCPRSNHSVEYINPYNREYPEIMKQSILNKYKVLYGKEFPIESNWNFEILSEPKRKGIFIKRFTPNETKVIGYMYKFSIQMHPTLQKIIYHTGLGDKINLGFGCIEILKNNPEPNIKIEE